MEREDHGTVTIPIQDYNHLKAKADAFNDDSLVVQCNGHYGNNYFLAKKKDIVFQNLKEEIERLNALVYEYSTKDRNDKFKEYLNPKKWWQL